MHLYRLPSVNAYPPPEGLQPELVFDGDEELPIAGEGELIPYAHRDIKPAYVLPVIVLKIVISCSPMMELRS
jgi:serine/threonine kinase 16